MIWLALIAQMSFAQNTADVAEKIQSARASISEAEKKQREMMGHLFVINKKIRDTAKKQARLSERLLEQEGKVRATVHELEDLEGKTERQQNTLNHRLRSLYQERKRGDYSWLFSAQSPVELERHHRYMRRIVDSDHRQLKQYLAHLKQLQQKRGELKTLVAGLSRMQKEAQQQEQILSAQMREKSKHVNELKRMKDTKLSELKGLRAKPSQNPEAMSYAFFERKGMLRPPVDAPLAREYGTYVDPQFRFRLMHKGLFYQTKAGAPVGAVYQGQVALADTLPGYGKTVIIDHGDNYYSVYAFASQLKVRKGDEVREGDVVAVSGGSSPLFGPGLYFEIRHFTDAIDPRTWIKDSVIKTANRSLSWDDVSGIAGP